ncbi:MAG: hypothetical protein JJT77_08650, partial [Crocinitomicaceae bacterium]|nr:hypothetical protein [Crocinitomicaceae bacterium]
MRIFTVLFFSTLIFIFSDVFSQARMVMSDNVYLVMDGPGALNNTADPIYLVIDNPNDNAITTTGMGGNIISERQANIVRWNIGTTASGTYTVPFTTPSSVKVPYEMTIDAAGVGAGRVDFSTYFTANNAVLPTGVTHLLDAATATTNNNGWVVDRFWIINADGYSTRPDVTMAFNYYTGEFGSNLVPGASSLVAQRFNTSQNAWQGSSSMSTLFFGADNLSGTVSGAVVEESDFFPFWTLVENANLLPVELLFFTADCRDNLTTISWATATEINNNYFTVLKSIDGEFWEPIATVQGNGNSSVRNDYQITDENRAGEKVYYQLVQVDFDGQFEKFAPISAACGERGRFEINIFPNPAKSLVNLGIQLSDNVRGEISIQLLDATGRLLEQRSIQPNATSLL